MAQKEKIEPNRHLVAGISALVLVMIVGSIWGYKKYSKLDNSYTALSKLHMSMGMTGDSTKRYSVSFATSPNPVPNQNVTLKFTVYDASTGSPVKSFDTLFTKLIHLVIVDGSLQYYGHIHPELNGSEFSITTQFPKADVYHLYLNFQPSGSTEQQFALTLPVGSSQATVPSTQTTSLSRTFGDIKVTLSTTDQATFKAQSMSDAAQILNFNFKDAKTDQPISDLQPYLGAFGHLTLINEQTYQYVHIHPIASDNPNAGGPDVKFLPAALFEKITPGIYRVFGQFQRNNKLFVADFTIKVE